MRLWGSCQITMADSSFSAPTSKRTAKKTYFPASGYLEYLYSQPLLPGPWWCQQWMSGTNRLSATHQKKEAKRLDPFGCKVYSTGSLQFRISKQQALLGRYDLHLWDTLFEFKDSLLQESRQEFTAIREEGKAVARTCGSGSSQLSSQGYDVGSLQEALFVLFRDNIAVAYFWTNFSLSIRIVSLKPIFLPLNLTFLTYASAWWESNDGLKEAVKIKKHGLDSRVGPEPGEIFSHLQGISWDTKVCSRSQSGLEAAEGSCCKLE